MQVIVHFLSATSISNYRPLENWIIMEEWKKTTPLFVEEGGHFQGCIIFHGHLPSQKLILSAVHVFQPLTLTCMREFTPVPLIKKVYLVHFSVNPYLVDLPGGFWSPLAWHAERTARRSRKRLRSRRCPSDACPTPCTLYLGLWGP